MPTESVDQLIEQLKDLKLQESVVLEKLSRARAKEKAQDRNDRAPRSTTYEPGDRVRIINTVKVPFTRSVNARDKTATVRYTRPHNAEIKVFITTDNGFKTWRLEKNITKIE
jgi:hypothetical protein